jgi:hypothetical protein
MERQAAARRLGPQHLPADAPPLLLLTHCRCCYAAASGGLYRATLRGHSAAVSKVVISPSGQQVVTASSDGTAQVGRCAAGRLAG